MDRKHIALILALLLTLVTMSVAKAERVTLSGVNASIELPDGWATMEESGETYYIAAIYNSSDPTYELGLLSIVDDSFADWNVQDLSDEQVSRLFAMLQLDMEKEYNARPIAQEDGPMMLSLTQSGGESMTYDLFFVDGNVVMSFYIYSDKKPITNEIVQILLEIVDSMENVEATSVK